jgi:hypothetical protein
MRLREINFIIKESIKNMTLKIVGTSRSADRFTEIKSINNITKYRQSIKKLKEVKLFNTIIESIEQTIAYKEIGDQVNVKTDDAKSFLDFNTILLNDCRRTIILIENAIEQQNEDSISIKLPQTDDLESISKYLHTISSLSSKILHNDRIKGEIKLLNFDTGTLWIDIALGSYVAYKLIASIAWTATVIKNKKLDIKIKEEEAKSLGLKNDNLTNLVKANKELIDLFIERETKEIDNHFFNKDSNVENSQKRIKEALKDITELIEKGAEIHPSLLAPEKKKELFPNYKDKGLLSSFQKLLENKDEIPNKSEE